VSSQRFADTRCLAETRVQLLTYTPADQRPCTPRTWRAHSRIAAVLKYDKPVLREVQIDSLANFLVTGLVARGAIKPLRDQKEIVACVVEMMSANFETERQIDEEANRMAEEEARKDPRADFNRLRTRIKQKLAERKGFVL
jgi:hypothetical protein